MAIQKINIGSAPNDKTGDQLREAFRKTNDNFAGLEGGKVDKVAGKGLSTNDFTDPEKQKLAGLEGSHYRGLYASLADLLAAVSDPKPGDYADVDGGAGSKVMRHIWDESDSKWEPQQGEPTQLTAAQVKALYESNADTNAFTDTEKLKLEGVTGGATKNSSDAYLLDRQNHTGTQLLNTISDSGTAAAMNAVGVGGIIEYGSNANGTYIKFAGGLLICMPVRMPTTAISSPFGALFRSEPELINFPHEFLSAPSLTMSANDDSAWCNSNNPSNQGVYLYAISPLNRASVTVGCTAIGYWKNPS
ncbi:MAG: hypothetical protein LBI76_09100 [Comamonas sp.]|nr:hypothetical protein [Comamonas sp.]